MMNEYVHLARISLSILTEKGYLRCAKTLLLNGKPDKALEVYAYGLKSLPTSHPRRHVSLPSQFPSDSMPANLYSW